jgi:hypothetical protein
MKTHPPKVVEKIDLPNNLVLEFYDYSRVVAGDILEKRGPIIYFELKKERNFIDERDKDQIFGQMLNELKEYSLSYMGHKSFAKGFIRRQIQAFEERQKWQKAII